jgi:hypothetical protein
MGHIASYPRRPIITAILGSAVLVATPLLLVAPGAAAPPSASQPGVTLDLGESGGLVTERDVTDIAPGLELTTFSRLDPAGWTAGSVLVADLASDGVSIDYEYSGAVTEPATVRGMAEASGATAAINGDFYDIDRSYAPIGIGVDRTDGLVSSPIGNHTNAIAVDPDGLAHLAEVLLEGSVTSIAGELPLSGVNTSAIPADGIGVYTPTWGAYPRATTVSGAADVTEVTVIDGEVAEIANEPGEGSIASNELVLVGRDDGAAALRDLTVGDEVDVTYAPRADFGEVAVALGGNHPLVVDGEPRTFSDPAAHPRSAIGIADGGATMFLVVIDGRQTHARGMTLTELGEFMADLGAEYALNVDGGGSSTLVTRTPATDELAVINSPSDGEERRVANGLGLFTDDGTGRLAGFRITAESDRVFPGLTRTLTALGHDETFAAVDSNPRWRTPDRRTVGIGRGAGNELAVTGLAPGTAEITAFERSAREETEITVLDELARIEPSTTLLVLPDAESTSVLEVAGFDAAGYQAPIEAADIKVSGGDGVVEVGADGTALTITGVESDTSALLTLDVAGASAEVAVVVGLTTETVADFSDAEDWTIEFARATGDIEAIEGPDGRPGVRLSYDFVAQAGNTRAAYATPPEQFVLPGQPQDITAWVEGDGNGTWIRMRVYDRDGTVVTLNGGYTEFVGWEQLTFPVPEGTQYPLTFRDIYAVQVGDVAYHGTTGFSTIEVSLAPDVDLPTSRTFPDPVVVTNGTVEASPFRVAVMNDAQFVGREPDSDIVAAARRTFQEIVAADPDVLVINGDLVDEAAKEDFDLARRVLDEELGDADFPWYYVPGNHEVQGGPLQNFIDEFGPTQYTVDYGGTRIVTLNSAFGTFRAGGNEFDQIVELRRALDEAASAPDITGVLVFAHHPPNDPLPAKNSQLVDRLEAAMVEKWLGDFVHESGKSAAYMGGHAGVFHAESLDGVPYLIVGNSGKDPAGSPVNGGFTGWTMLGVDPAAGVSASGPGRPVADSPWLRAEVLARVDTIALSAPETLAVGESGDVSATVDQDEGRIVPVTWPMSAQWGGERVHVGSASTAGSDAVVAYDPASGTVTALRSGQATLTVTVNGETASTPLTITP